MNTLKIWKTGENSHLPEYGTSGSACFDLKASLRDVATCTLYGNDNRKRKSDITKSDVPYILLMPHERILVPTGLVFDLDSDQMLDVMIRSSVAVKHGVILVNSVGIIDSDYVNQTYIPLLNTSSGPFVISDGMRLAQARVVNFSQSTFKEVFDEPGQKTDRIGGIGSTGTS